LCEALARQAINERPKLVSNKTETGRGHWSKQNHCAWKQLETGANAPGSTEREAETDQSDLRARLENVTETYKDLQNLVLSTDMAVLFLDSCLRIKQVTPRLDDVSGIAATDIGRLITDCIHSPHYDRLAAYARTVLEGATSPIEHEVRGQDGGLYLLRVRPSRATDDRILGIGVTFVDIGKRRQIEDTLRESEARLNQEMRLVDVSRSPIFVWDFDSGIVRWNRGSERLYGYSSREALGQRKEKLLQTLVPNSSFEAVRESLLANGVWKGELLHTTKQGKIITVESEAELWSLGARRLVLESTRDITEEKKWEERRRLLLRELSHRVSNTLAVVQSIARQTLRTTTSESDFVSLFEGRLSALALSHRLLVEANWEGAELGSLARNQLAAYVSDDPQRLQIRGAPVTLPAALAMPFGLALHELGTNAVKYGALSDGNGRVTLVWQIDTENGRQKLRLSWQESGGPAVAPPTKRGFGSMMIERGLHGAKVRRDFAPGGLVCTIELNLSKRKLLGSNDV
jgi:two-component system, chemotaxis family, CheB/CheR fusion protein